jgi:hypothetical protein
MGPFFGRIMLFKLQAAVFNPVSPVIFHAQGMVSWMFAFPYDEIMKQCREGNT